MALLRAEEEAKVREWFAELERPVELLVALGPEETPRAGSGDVDFGAEVVRVCEGLAELGEGVTCRIEQEPEGFPRLPAVSIRPDRQRPTRPAGEAEAVDRRRVRGARSTRSFDAG